MNPSPKALTECAYWLLPYFVYDHQISCENIWNPPHFVASFHREPALSPPIPKAEFMNVITLRDLGLVVYVYNVYITNQF